MISSTVKPSILGAQLKRRKWMEQDGKFASWSDHPWTFGHWRAGNRSGRARAAELRLPLTLFGAGPNTESPPGSLGLGVWGWEKRRGQEEMISIAEGPWWRFTAVTGVSPRVGMPDPRDKVVRVTSVCHELKPPLICPKQCHL